MLKMIPVPIPNTWLFWLLLLASFFFGIPASDAAFLKNIPSGAKNYFLTDLSPDQSPKHEDSCRVPRQNPRDSSSVLTVFIQEDPLRDGYHWYGYVNGDPVNKNDPSGYFSSGLSIGSFSHGGATEQQAVQRFKSWVQGLQPVNSGVGRSSMSPAQRLEFAAGFVPIANDLQDLHVLVTGQTPVSQEPVSWFERGIAGACLVIGGSYTAYHHWSKGKTAATNADPFISVYHGSYSNYNAIMKNGLNSERVPAYVTRDRDAARNATYGRYDPPTDSGVVESKILQSDFDKFFKPKEQVYNGFQGANLQSTEILLETEEAISIFNKGIQK